MENSLPTLPLNIIQPRLEEFIVRQRLPTTDSINSLYDLRSEEVMTSLEFPKVNEKSFSRGEYFSYIPQSCQHNENRQNPSEQQAFKCTKFKSRLHDRWKESTNISSKEESNENIIIQQQQQSNSNSINTALKFESKDDVNVNLESLKFPTIKEKSLSHYVSSLPQVYQHNEDQQKAKQLYTFNCNKLKSGQRVGKWKKHIKRSSKEPSSSESNIVKLDPRTRSRFNPILVPKVLPFVDSQMSVDLEPIKLVKIPVNDTIASVNSQTTTLRSGKNDKEEKVPNSIVNVTFYTNLKSSLNDMRSLLEKIIKTNADISLLERNQSEFQQKLNGICKTINQIKEVSSLHDDDEDDDDEEYGNKDLVMKICSDMERCNL